MPEQPNSQDGLISLAQRLAKETGITESEAADLLSVLGTNWSSLVREARVIRRRRKPVLSWRMRSSDRAFALWLDSLWSRVVAVVCGLQVWLF
jgi:hypothetical protein